MKCHENTSSGSHAVPYNGQTDRTHIRNTIVAFHNCAVIAPKNRNSRSSLAAFHMQSEL